MTTFQHEMPFGAEVREDSVRFRLWAPAQRQVSLMLESGPAGHDLPMASTGDGWFELATDAGHAGDRYRYRLEDGTRVPDPASRFQPEDVHGPSEVIDPRAFDWQHTAWRGRPWREAVVYEAHVGAYSAAGDYDGLREMLDHLAELGVTALELMPLSDFDGRRNWGYDGVLPFAPDSSYGRPEALKRLVDEAHGRNLMVLLDVVYNHFGPTGNWLGKYAPQFFTDRHHTPWGKAIDFGVGEVRRFFIDNALYWLGEYRFDGLRFDAVDQIRDDGEPHILNELAETVRSRISDRDIHIVLENDHNAAHLLGGGQCPHHATTAGRTPSAVLPADGGRCPPYAAQWNDDFHHAAHVLATGEHGGYYADYKDSPAAALARALAEGFVYQGEYSEYRGHTRGERSAALPPLAFVDFLQNHDQIGNRAFGERLPALADADAFEALTAIWLLAPAVPMFFMGQEWGATQPFLFFCDFHGDLADAVREGRRREFAKFAAFADPEARERIPDPNAESTFTASVLDWNAAETPDGQRTMDFTRELLRIRRTEIEPYLGGDLHGGGYAVSGSALHVEWPLADGARLHLAANPCAEPATGLDLTLPGKRLFARPENLSAGTITQLPPWSLLWSRA
ncbi:MAG TPA: malto-oligosyltrehalose trehalohydrolase [Rhodanobacteraceae bacterium]|nr:malto-oligosyltrehalose trehalohydrolase [Rhodanobacteraceae bacterium]